MTTEEFKKQGNEIHNNEYEYDEVEFIDYKTPVKINCKKHGLFLQKPGNHLSGKSGCKLCGYDKQADKKRISFDILKERWNNKFEGKYTYDKSDYKNAHTKIEITCDNPEHGSFFQTPNSHNNGSGCPKCGRLRSDASKRLTQERFKERCEEAHGNTYEYPDEYVTDRTLTRIVCKKHGDFFQIPLNHFKGVGCPSCAKTDSKPEREIKDFLLKHVELNHRDNTSLGDKFQLDIFIPNVQVGVEYNGLYYHSDKFRTNSYHLNKTKKGLDKGIKVIHIFEDEWTNKKEIVKSRLLNAVKKTENKIFARNCKIKEITAKESKDFLEANHIQGNVSSRVKVGLFYNNELVSLMTFGGLRKNLGQTSKEGSWELLRFCNKLNTVVVGGASKLLNYFEINYKPEEVISYADRRWSNGDLYHNLNFTLESETEPNYFYTKKGSRENRFKYRKDVLVKEGFDKEKTEREIMSERGFYRVYDCGSLKFSKKYLHN